MIVIISCKVGSIYCYVWYLQFVFWLFIKWKWSKNSKIIDRFLFKRRNWVQSSPYIYDFKCLVCMPTVHVGLYSGIPFLMLVLFEGWCRKSLRRNVSICWAATSITYLDVRWCVIVLTMVKYCSILPISFEITSVSLEQWQYWVLLGLAIDVFYPYPP